MNEQEIKDRVKELLVEKFKLDRLATDISDDDEIFGSGVGLNSIQGVELLVTLELEFDIEFDEDDILAEVFPNVKVLSQYIKQKQEEED